MEAQSDLDFSQMLLHRGEQEEPCDGRLLTTNPSDLTQANAAKRKAGMSATILQDGSHQDGPASSTSAKRSKLSLGRDTTLRRLACPYSKRDRHQAQLPEICLGPGWNKVTRIR
ncbi:hypothetical protein GGR56DRAFT_658754 [Xylariaceae sp. FL0804]|nr:hypothetical protein GGR56DRAFT_658754 [Xylariaceae sp. FL0804]